MAQTASVVHPNPSLRQAGRRPLLWWLACCCLGLLSTTLAAELPPGTVVGKDNAALVEARVSPGVLWCVLHGMRIQTVPYKRIEWNQAYREATQRYASQVQLAPDGRSLVGHVAGLPFPHLDPNEMPFNPSITMVDMQLNHATRWGLPSPKVTGEQGWYFNQGEKTGLAEDFFTLGHLTASVR